MTKKDFIKFLLKVFGTIAVVMTIAVIVGTIQRTEIERAYNNGICTECGGDYKFINASVSGIGSFTTHYYFYQCEECGKLIEISK